MRRGMAFVGRRGWIAPSLVALCVLLASSCTSNSNGTVAESEFEEELIAVTKKAKNRQELHQMVEDKIKEKHGFVAAKKTPRKVKKKVR